MPTAHHRFRVVPPALAWLFPFVVAPILAVVVVFLARADLQFPFKSTILDAILLIAAVALPFLFGGIFWMTGWQRDHFIMRIVLMILSSVVAAFICAWLSILVAFVVFRPAAGL